MALYGVFMRTLYFITKYLICSMLIFGSVFVLNYPVFKETTNASVNDVKNGMTIIIDAGHGGEDCGAIGINGIFEKDINLKIAFNVSNLLTLAGFDVCLTRTEDKMLYREEENIYGQRKIYDLRNRLLIAEPYEDAIFLSIHMNSFPVEKYSGLQVWYQSESDLSYQLALNIQNTVKKYIQHENTRKVKPSDKSMYLLDRCKHPTVLIECGFLSNSDECAKLSDEIYQKELSFVIFCGIMETLEREIQN